MNEFKYVLGVACGICLFTGPPATAGQDAAGPNIVVMISDDHGAGHGGYDGNPDVRTPHLDSKPVKGAIVAGRFHLHDPIQSFGFSDEEGACSVELPADAQHLKLFARTEGYGLVDHSVSLKDHSNGEAVRIRLRPAASISGRLVDEHGKPASGCGPIRSSSSREADPCKKPSRRQSGSAA